MGAILQDYSIPMTEIANAAAKAIDKKLYIHG